MARRELVRKPRRRPPNPTTGLDSGWPGVGHDVPRADFLEASGLDEKPSSPGDYASTIKEKTQDKIKDIKGRLTELLSSFEDSYSPTEGLEDYVRGLERNTSPLEMSALNPDVKLMINDYTGMCVERQELLSSLQDWFDTSSIDDEEPGIGDVSVRESLALGKETVKRLDEVKPTRAKIARLIEIVGELMAEKKQLEKELLEARESAEKAQTMQKKVLNEAAESNKRQDNVWKNAASEVCKLLGVVRESGQGEVNRLIEEMDEMVKTLEERSALILSLQRDAQQQRGEIDQYRKKVSQCEATVGKFTLERELWENQLTAIKEELSESKQQYEQTQSQLQELKQKTESNTDELKRQQDKQAVSSGQVSEREQKRFQQEEDETKEKRHDLDDEEPVLTALRSQLQTMEQENSGLKAKLDEREGNIESLRSEMAALQDSKAISTNTTAASEMKGDEHNCESQMPDLEKHQPSRAGQVPFSADLRETVASEKAVRHEEHKIDQHVQTDLSWSETGQSAVGGSFYDHHRQGDNAVSGQRVVPISSSACVQQTDSDLHRSHLSGTLDISQRGSATHISRSAQEFLSFPHPPDEVAIGSEVDTASCHRLGLQLADTLKERLMGALHNGATTAMIENESENWLFEQIYRSGMQQYVHGMVSRAREIIIGFVQKVSTMVDAANLTAAAAVHSLRHELPEDEQHQTEVDLPKTEADSNPSMSETNPPIHQQGPESSVFPFYVDAVSGKSWRSAPFSSALSVVGTHCMHALQSTNELFKDKLAKQKVEMGSVVKAFINRKGKRRGTESMPRTLGGHRRSVLRELKPVTQAIPDVLNLDITGGSLAPHTGGTKLEPGGHLRVDNQKQDTEGVRKGIGARRKTWYQRYPQSSRPYTSGGIEETTNRHSLVDPSVPLIKIEQDDNSDQFRRGSRQKQYVSEGTSHSQLLPQPRTAASWSQQQPHLERPRPSVVKGSTRTLNGSLTSSIPVARLEQDTRHGRRNTRQIQNTVSGMTSVHHYLAQPLVTSHLHFMEVPVPKSIANHRGSVRLERRKQNPARATRPQTQQPVNGQKRPSYQRRQPGGRPAKKLEEPKDLSANDGSKKTERKKNAEEYKHGVGAIHNARAVAMPAESASQKSQNKSAAEDIKLPPV